MPTIKDVAASAGVSISTVSRVMNDHPHVRPEVRARVREAVSALGFAPNRLASNFRRQRSRIVGVLLRKQKTPFSSALGNALEDEFFEHGYSSIICSTHADPEREEVYVRSMIDMRVEGVVMRPSGSDAAVGRVLARLDRAGIPVVLADRVPRRGRLSGVVCDNYGGGFEGMRHLLSLGHRRIGVIAGEAAQEGIRRRPGDVGAARVRGIRAAAGELADGVELHFSRGFSEATLATGREEAARLLRRHPDVTAIFATTDILAVGTMQAVQQAGVSVPDEISLLGYDGLMISEITHPPLSTVAQPIEEMGQLAARTLLSLIESPTLPRRRVELDNHVLARGTTGPVP